MSRSPGATSAVSGAVAPPALRFQRAGWRDPRLWVGVLLVAVSVVVGARLLASADESVAVWAVAADQGGGATLAADDLTVRRVRFVDDADLGRYFAADVPFPESSVLTRSIGAGELVPRSAVVAGDQVDLVQVPLEVQPNRVPAAVDRGSVISVYLDDRAARRGADGVRALVGVTVVDAPAYDAAFAVSGHRQLVVAVPGGTAEAFEQLLASMDDPVLRVHVDG
ncbi:hypothetical protein E8D34_09380 [Nocardioides sp. GY 10113]|uniref:hypothetical protein n=1 Tax=Nocardioides sp. GY 10113 TaxID=2569761 RepID=UPI0010A860E9|nr:hypothetical protein [Nocardioides sp. GY 10113]TIC87342.1 hypothetical protein E8D34_09380 [Nocardioides sp. GY 10113]